MSEGLDVFYRQAVEANELRVLGRPSADVIEWPNEKDFSGDLLVEVEVDVRPEFELPAFEGTTVEVDAVEVDESAIDEELDRLRARFGTLVTVDRPAATGDFVELDLVATIDGAEIDRAEGVSYEVGSGELLEGIDEAIDSLTAGEDTTFRSTLVGGDHAGEEAEVAVVVKAVKERELPEADDDFAQIASEFDTIAELRDSLKDRVGQQSTFTQGSAARDKLIEQLLEQVEIPVPPAAHRGRGAHPPRGRRPSRGRRAPRRGHRGEREAVPDADAARRDRRERSTSRSRRTSSRSTSCSPPRSTAWLRRTSSNALQENNQLPRSSARSPATRLSPSRSARSTSSTPTAAPVDLTGFVAVEDEAEAEDEVVEEAEEIADAAAEADAVIEAEEAEAEARQEARKPAKKTAADKK